MFYWNFQKIDTMLLCNKRRSRSFHFQLVETVTLLLLVARTYAESHDTSILNSDSQTYDLLMRGAKPTEPDSYLCTAYPIKENETYIYKFEALANASTAHHILLYGCNGEAASNDPFWTCSSMCKNSEAIISFAWAKNAPATVLPKDVGLRIGQDTNIKTIVLQVHYARQFNKDEQPDHSGIRIYVTPKPQPYVAGIYFMGSSFFFIPPGQSSFPVDVSCAFNMQESIFPFAYRTHAHERGKVITGYMYNNTYHKIGKGNPQWPQAFYPVKDKIEIKPGDYLAARCTYDSTSMTKAVSVGSTGKDEMCNFYIMFYTNSSVRNPSGFCNEDYFKWLTGNNFPSDVSEPLPSNPELEEAAKGHQHHHGPHGGGESDVKVSSPVAETRTEDILMPGAKPEQPDTYLCTAHPITDSEVYIYKFEAVANASTAHHIILFGCNVEHSSDKPIVDCSSVCKEGEKSIMFAWAKNAPATSFPKDVGMRVGTQTEIKSLVLQIHYARSFTADEPPDHSGIRIYLTQKKQPFVAGMYLMATSFIIPPGRPSYPVDISCRFTKKTSIYPFSYRVHAHNIGKVITGYLFNGSYYEIGKGNPNWPQAFYPVKDKIEIKEGDYLTARCTFDSSSLNQTVYEGSTGQDEMCNMYLMYYTDSAERDVYLNCLGNAVPQLTGDNFPPDVSVPLPPNPALEEQAKGHHHHGGMGGPETPVHEGIHFEHSLELNPSWPVNTLSLGQIGGVATDSDGNVYIFHRGSRKWDAQSFSVDDNFLQQDSPIPEDVIVILDSQGQLIRKFGAGQFYMPHGIEVDKDGNIWLTDVALHQVFKINHGETTPSLVLGQKFVHGTDSNHFCKPTDVAVLSSGEFFVSDGYCNGRVLKFSKNGTLIKTWGERNIGLDSPPARKFHISHSITVSEQNQLVCVADRENGRIQCFDTDGNFKHIIKHPEFGTKLFAIEQSPHQGGVLYAVNGPSGYNDFPVQGFTVNIRTGELLETWNVPKHFQNPHDVCVHSGTQSVYIGELNSLVWKLSRESAVTSPRKMNHEHLSNTQASILQTETAGDIVTAGNQGDRKPLEGSNKTSLAVHGHELDRLDNSHDDVIVTIVIGFLMIVPIVFALVIIFLVRLRKSGKMNCFKKKHPFGMQEILSKSHKGFDRLKSEDSENESEKEQSLETKKINNMP